MLCTNEIRVPDRSSKFWQSMLLLYCGAPPDNGQEALSTCHATDIRQMIGWASACMTQCLAAENMPLRNNPLVTRLRNANGVVLGKTRMHELAYGITTINPDNGTVLNPYNNLMHCGGSSGGTASIVAARGGSLCSCFGSAWLEILPKWRAHHPTLFQRPFISLTHAALSSSKHSWHCHN